MNKPGVPNERAARRFGLHGVLAFAAVFLAAVPFGIMVVLVREKAGWLKTIDLQTATNLHSYDESHPSFVNGMKVITNSGSTLAWIVILTAAGLWLLYRRLFRLAAFLAVTAIGSSLLNAAIKQAVGRTRPVLADPIATASGKSFPSGHTQAAIVGYGILVLVFLPAVARRWRPVVVTLAGVMVVLIGFSRVALGVHYVSDVVGAVIIGSAWLLAMTAAFSAWRQDRHLGPVQPAEGLEPESAARIDPQV
jgi:membrane-associated phospholipid phosphatase